MDNRYSEWTSGAFARILRFRSTLVALITGVLLFGNKVATLHAQSYSINWFKIAGGGGASQAGNYSLRGTIGQWDAGSESAGSFSLEGGFWVGATASAGGFAPGNLLVEGVGDGPPGLGNYGQLVWIDELTTNGVLAQTKYMPTNYPLPTVAPFNLMDEGSEIWDGYLTRSADGQSVCIPGYNGTNHQLVLTSSSSSTVLRVIGVLGPEGALDTSRAVDMFSHLNFYSVTSKDGSGFWAVGEANPLALGGLVYFQPGAVTNSLTNALLRCVRIYNNQLYVSPQPGASTTLVGGIYAVGSGLPTSGNPRLTQIFPLGGSPNQFEFNPAMTIAYVADDGLYGNGGIKKYTYNGTSWRSNYTLSIPGGGNTGARGLAVDWSGDRPVIFATTTVSTGNKLVRIVDTGANSTPVTLRSAPVFTAYRGVTWTPARLVAPTLIPKQMSPDRTFEMTFSGPAGQTYRVLASSDATAPLANWTVLAAGVFGAGPVTFIDADAANWKSRFYLIVSP